ncbi:MAG TPA: helix-turn-helix domain-containing protein [Candidatus Dojkabacteria bacterium]|nr:helix-turn-helix domain-containing protein [Candidatus Dojkabacteria bacterium]HQF36627.1 helix-turn-helix domain-containing protein [Candidatus Dojkabacteria bacterium]
MNNDFSYLTPGKLLHDARENKGLDIEHVAMSIKIRKDYIIAIENDDYSDFESPVYAKGFIKLYARFLGIDEENIMALYRRFISIDGKANEPEVPKSTRPISKLNFVITPKTIAIGSIALILLVILGYLFLQVYYYQKPPNLQINIPTEERTETDNRTVTVSGYTDIGASVLINDSIVNVDEKGYFETEVTLRVGDNVIIIKAMFQDGVGKEAIKELYVTRNSDDQASESEVVITQPIKNSFNAEVSVQGGQAWLEIYIDGEIKVARIVQSGYIIEFDAEKTFEITSGVPSFTKVKIDEQEQSLTLANGVGSLTCELSTNGNVDCK